MKILISREALTTELSKIQGVVSQKSTLAILSNALLVADGQTLELHATDLDVTISTACECEVVEPGRVTLQAKRLFDVVKNIRADEIELTTEANHYTQLKAGQVSARLPGMPAESFANIANYDDLELHDLGTAQLMDMIEKTLFSISTDEGRPSLNGAFFRATSSGGFSMISTDGHRLSRIELAPPVDEEGNPILPEATPPAEVQRGVIISRKGLSELKRTLDIAEKDLKFGLKDNNIVFRHGPATVSIRLIDGTFPDVDQVLPRESETKAIIRRDDLIQTLKFVAVQAPPKTGNVRITFDTTECEIYTQDAEQGEARQVIPVEYDGSKVQAGYNYKYLLDVLNVLNTEEISMEIVDTLSPTMIRDANRDDLLFVVMPMRI